MGIETDKLCYGEFIWDAAVKNAGKRLADDEYTEADIGYLFAVDRIARLEAENAQLSKGAPKQQLVDIINELHDKNAKLREAAQSVVDDGDTQWDNSTAESWGYFELDFAVVNNLKAALKGAE